MAHSDNENLLLSDYQKLPFKVSRRSFLGGTAAAFILGIALPKNIARAQSDGATVVPGRNVSAFLKIDNNGSIHFQCPFIEGGQGIYTGMAQIVGEELDADPATFIVECAPPGADYLVMNGGGMRITGGSMSVRTSYDTMRKLGAYARHMLLDAASRIWGVDIATLTTQPGKVLHAASARELTYGELAESAASSPIPSDVTVKDPSTFRWIGKPVRRLDVAEKATGKAVYSIDVKVDGMLYAAVQHAPRFGMQPGTIRNSEHIKGQTGIRLVKVLDGAVGVVADHWWQAKKAAESLQIDWLEPEKSAKHAMPADYSTEQFRRMAIDTREAGLEAEKHGDPDKELSAAAKIVEAVYDAPYILHAQLEPPSCTARFNRDGTLELWMPNQAPETFQKAAADTAGLPVEKVMIHSPLIGGFFGRHFLYSFGGNPFPQAIALAKAAGRPVKLIWSREEEFLRDTHRPMGIARFKAGLDAQGVPMALRADVIGEGPGFSMSGRPSATAIDPNGVEGMVDKPYAIADRAIYQIPLPHVPTIGYWRSVGHSMNDFLYETFFDEMADAGKNDPYALRLSLLGKSPRHKKLLEAVGALSGGWKRGPYRAEDGTTRARGVAMASPFGTEVATIAEVSRENGKIVVHNVWIAIDPGSIVNPAIIEAQMNSAVAIGLSITLFEEVIYENGMPTARNYDRYPILTLADMPAVHVKIIESGEKMGGIGEPGVPGVPPAVVNALAALTGKRARRLPLSRMNYDQ
ncbi:xanthine dehydrogenase family protein molybdopterin-binding subunit [Bartonella sp. LJL80]